MSENKFYIFILGLISAIFIVLIATIGACSIYESRLVSEAIKNGVDPISARCAISGSSNSPTMCAISARANK